MTGASFVIQVHLHDDRWHGLPEWPPAPFRLFQALVAAAARGARIGEEHMKALRWLEEQEPPHVLAPFSTPGKSVTSFVPNNDLDAVGGDPDKVEKIRAGKIIRPRLLFHDPAFVYIWEGVIPPEDILAQLKDICGHLYQLGRGVDMAWARAGCMDSAALARIREAAGCELHLANTGAGASSLPAPCPGSLDSLVERYSATRRRLTAEASGRRGKTSWHFRQPPKPRARMVCYGCPPRRRLFELRDAHDETACRPWARRHIAQLTAFLRDRAARRLEGALPEQTGDIERFLIGRGAAEADKARRVRIVPLPSIGHAHAGGAIRRVLVEVPQGCPLRAADVFWAFEGLSPDEKVDGATGEIRKEGTCRLTATEHLSMLDHYGVRGGPQTLWRTVTPATLPAPRGGKKGLSRLVREKRAIKAVRQALRHAGIAAEAAQIRVQREPFDRNASPAGEYAFSERFPAERLWHVEIAFGRPVSGPLIIGNGRYLGLGLMAPVVARPERRREDAPDAFVFRLPGDGLPAGKAEQLVKCARAALMALDGARHDGGRARTLFSGHEGTDTGPARSGSHRHVFLTAPCSADGRIHELLVIPPWLADHHPRTQELRKKEAAHFAAITSHLRAVYGPGLPRMALLPAPEEDVRRHPLLAPARTWESNAPFVTTRRYRASRDSGPEDFLAEDIRRELTRRHLPLPRRITILRASPAGDGRWKGWARLDFAAPVSGPFLLGHESHRGAGAFAGFV